MLGVVTLCSARHSNLCIILGLPARVCQPGKSAVITSLGCVQLSVREGRVLRTRTIDNDLNPKWNQSFNLLVDDLDTQSLRARVELSGVQRF